MWYLYFSFWLISVSMILSSCIHAAVNDIISFFLWLSNIPFVYMYNTISSLSIHVSIPHHLFKQKIAYCNFHLHFFFFFNWMDTVDHSIIVPISFSQLHSAPLYIFLGLSYWRTFGLFPVFCFYKWFIVKSLTHIHFLFLRADRWNRFRKLNQKVDAYGFASYC